MHINLSAKLKFFIILEWLYKKGHDVQFVGMSKEVLAAALQRFYTTVRQKKSDESEGKCYAKQSLVNIRSALNRHLQDPLFNKTWDLIHDNEFKSANKVFLGV